MFANVATGVDRVRRYVNAPTAEYAIEVQFRVVGDGVTVKRPCEPRELGRLWPDRSLSPGTPWQIRPIFPNCWACFTVISGISLKKMQLTRI